MLKKSIQFENLKTHLSGTNVCNYMYYQKCPACYLRAGHILIHIEAIVQFKWSKYCRSVSWMNSPVLLSLLVSFC